MRITAPASAVPGLGLPYVPEMRKLIGHNLIASPGARAVIRRPGSEDVLLHRRVDFGVWALPAGSPQIGESIVDCLKREVWEEIDLEVSDHRAFGYSSNPDHEVIRYPNGDLMHCYSMLFEVRLASYDLAAVDMARIAAETRELKWFPLNDLPEMIGNHRRNMDSYLAFLADGQFKVD